MATVGKKFISPDKWDSAWFAELTPEQKLLFIYLWERADHAGVIEIVLPIWSAHVGIVLKKEDLELLQKEINRESKRLEIIGDKVLLTEYIRFQQKPDQEEPLAGKHGFTKTIARCLKAHKLYEHVKKSDPILFSEYEEEIDNPDSSKPYQSLAQDFSKGLSKSPIEKGSQSRSGKLPPAKREERESMTKVAERILNVWDGSGEEIYFSEAPKVEYKLRELHRAGHELKEAESMMREYIINQRAHVRETGKDADLCEIIDAFEVDEHQ